MENKEKTATDSNEKSTYAGIPKAVFVDNVEAYMKENGDNINAVLKSLDEQHNKYKFMEYNLLAKKKKLRTQLPDLRRSLQMIQKLEQQTDEFETEYLLSEQVFLKAAIPPTKTVCLWLGANVMLEYSLQDAKELLQNNMSTATKNLAHIEHDLDFLRDQTTTTEVNMARVFNWNVKKVQAAKLAGAEK